MEFSIAEIGLLLSAFVASNSISTQVTSPNHLTWLLALNFKLIKKLITV